MDAAVKGAGLVPPPAAQRNLAAHLHPAQGPGGCEGPDHLGDRRRFRGLPGSPARRRSAEEGDLQKEPPGGAATEPAGHGLGRSRGGLAAQLRLALGQGREPVAMVISAGQRRDCPHIEIVLGRIGLPRLGPTRLAIATGYDWLGVRYTAAVFVAAVNESL